MKVLIVDDKETWHKLFDIVLSLRGIDVLHAKTVREALNTASVERPDVAIVDSSVSMASGYEVLEGLVNLGIPVIFIGHEKEGFDEERAKSLGAVETLRKPFTVEELLSVLRRVKSIEKPAPKEPELVIPMVEEESAVESLTLQPEEEIPIVPVEEEEVVPQVPVEEVGAPKEELVVEEAKEEVSREVEQKVKELTGGEAVTLPEERIEEIIREVAWEVIPEIAEKVIREEIEKLIKSRLA